MGQQLSDADKKKEFDGFNLFGLVKEIGVDDEGLEGFHSDYFKYPLYLDETKSFYTALGNRKLSGTSLFGLLYQSLFGSLGKRMKGITGNMKGEGKAVYSYQE